MYTVFSSGLLSTYSVGLYYSARSSLLSIHELLHVDLLAAVCRVLLDGGLRIPLVADWTLHGGGGGGGD